MKMSERQAKIPSQWRYPIIVITALILVAPIFFDFLGIGTLFKWFLIVLGLVGALIGGYFVYLRTKG